MNRFLRRWSCRNLFSFQPQFVLFAWSSRGSELARIKPSARSLSEARFERHWWTKCSRSSLCCCISPGFRDFLVRRSVFYVVCPVLHQATADELGSCCMCGICTDGFRISGRVGRSNTRGSRKSWLQYGRGVYFSGSSGKANDFAASTKRVRPYSLR